MAANAATTDKKQKRCKKAKTQIRRLHRKVGQKNLAAALGRSNELVERAKQPAAAKNAPHLGTQLLKIADYNERRDEALALALHPPPSASQITLNERHRNARARCL